MQSDLKEKTKRYPQQMKCRREQITTKLWQGGMLVEDGTTLRKTGRKGNWIVVSGKFQIDSYTQR